MLEARQRGVLFDIGHGMGSFSFEAARVMLAGSFMPDTISSDVHAICIEGPAFDLITTMSKFLCLGVPLDAVVKAATVNAATALQRPDLGSLKPGGAGDASIIAVVVRASTMDSTAAKAVAIGGWLWEPETKGERS